MDDYRIEKNSRGNLIWCIGQLLISIVLLVFSLLKLWTQYVYIPVTGSLGEPLIDVGIYEYSILQKLFEYCPFVGIMLLLLMGATIVFSVANLFLLQKRKVVFIGKIVFAVMVVVFIIGVILAMMIRPRY